MFLAVRAWPQEWSSSKTSEIFGTKILLKCGVEEALRMELSDGKRILAEVAAKLDQFRGSL